MRLRRSSVADTERLFEVWKSAVDATHRFVLSADLEYYGQLVRHEYLPRAIVEVAVDAADRPLGFMGIKGSYIDALFVASDWHGRGIGRLLIESAQQRFADGLTVDVNEQNTAALGFYERMHFRVSSRSPVDSTGRPYPLLHLAWP